MVSVADPAAATVRPISQLSLQQLTLADPISPIHASAYRHYTAAANNDDRFIEQQVTTLLHASMFRALKARGRPLVGTLVQSRKDLEIIRLLTWTEGRTATWSTRDERHETRDKRRELLCFLSSDMINMHDFTNWSTQWFH